MCIGMQEAGSLAQSSLDSVDLSTAVPEAWHLWQGVLPCGIARPEQIGKFLRSCGPPFNWYLKGGQPASGSSFEKHPVQGTDLGLSFCVKVDRPFRPLGGQFHVLPKSPGYLFRWFAVSAFFSLTLRAVICPNLS